GRGVGTSAVPRVVQTPGRAAAGGLGLSPFRSAAGWIFNERGGGGGLLGGGGNLPGRGRGGSPKNLCAHRSFRPGRRRPSHDRRRPARETPSPITSSGRRRPASQPYPRPRHGHGVSRP